MKRRYFLQLFAAVPAVVMAQRAIPSVLGQPEYLSVDDAGLVVKLFDSERRVIAVKRLRDFKGGRYEVVFKHEEIRGVMHDFEAQFMGHVLPKDRRYYQVFLPVFHMQPGDTLTVQGEVRITAV